MANQETEIKPYAKGNRSELLALLLELHSDWFKKSAAPLIRELNAENDVLKSYQAYLDDIEADKSNNWKILCAFDSENRMTGFIIGSISEDESLVLKKTGVIEDWLVREIERNKGIGTALYLQLENWFKEKGCSRVISDTWKGNDISILSHLKQGFFISGVSFGKVL